MNRPALAGILGLFFLTAWSASAPGDEPGEAGFGPDYKLVYWFDWSDPVRTFRHQAYRLKDDGYPSEAVSAWKQGLRQSHPTYAVLIRDVRLADVPGETVEEKLEEAVRRQFSEVVMIASVPGPTPSLGPVEPEPSKVHRRVLRPDWAERTESWRRPIEKITPSGRLPPGSAGFQPGPGPTPTPFPMPYTRPHP